MYISLGSSCSTIYQIEKHCIKKETLFFDWLISNKFSDILYVLKNFNDSEKILNENSITINRCVDNKTKIKFNKLEECYSIHDISCDYRKNDIENFLAKYKRRLNRTIECINKEKETIYFLRVAQEHLISESHKIEFHNCISKINKNCNYFLVYIAYGSDFENSIEYEDKFINIHLKENFKYRHWTLNHLDWKFVFDFIKRKE